MRILIATDGSHYSQAAIEESCRSIIRPERDTVLVVSAFEDMYPVMAEPIVVSGEYYQKIEAAVHEQCENFVQQAVERIAETFAPGKVSVSGEVLRGTAEQQIVEKAEKWGADLIVVGSHGRGFWGRLLGSVSNGVTHHAPCSVLVVRNRSS